MYNSVASADNFKSTSINPSSIPEVSGLLYEIVQIQNSPETVETQSTITSSALPQPTKRYQTAVTSEFWDEFKHDLSREEFYGKFRNFIFSNWDISKNLTGSNLTYFCKDKNDTEKYIAHNQACFEAELKKQAIRIIVKISKLIEIDINTKYFEQLKKTSCLDKQQLNQQRSLPREKIRAILKMTEYYCETYDDIYCSYLENMKIDLTKISDEDISKFIKASTNKKNTATKRTREIQSDIKFYLLEIYQSIVDDYLADLDKSSKRNAISISRANETSLLEFVQAEPSKSELNGKTIDVSQGRIFDIIENKIKEKSIIATDRNYVFNPKHGYPARYYYSKIPITDLKCKKSLMRIKLEILNLIRHEKENTHNSSDQQIVRNKLAVIDSLFSEYVQSVLEHQEYVEITYSEKKNTIQQDITLARMKTWTNRVKKILTESEIELNTTKEMLDKVIGCTGINEEEMIIPYLLQYLNTKGEELIYDELSKQKYRELIGIQVRKKEDTLPNETAMIAARSDSTESFLEELDIDLNAFIKLPTKEPNKEELNAREREVLNSLYEKISTDEIITEIGIRKRKGSASDYYAARKQFYLNWYQIALLELKIALANFIINEDHTKISNSIEEIEDKFSNKNPSFIEKRKNNFLNKISNSLKKREERFLNLKALKKAEKFARHALRYMTYSDLFERVEESTVLDQRARNWMHVSPPRMEKIEKNLNVVREKLNSILKDPRINIEEFNTRFESFVSSKLLEKGLVSVILNIPSEIKSASPSSPATTKNGAQITLQGGTKRSHDGIADEKEPKAKKSVSDEDEDDDDDIDGDSDLLAFLNNLHDSGLANMNLAEDLMIDDEFVDSLLATDVFDEQLIEDIDFHLPTSAPQLTTDHFIDFTFPPQMPTQWETLSEVNVSDKIMQDGSFAQISYVDTDPTATQIDFNEDVFEAEAFDKKAHTQQDAINSRELSTINFDAIQFISNNTESTK